MRREKKSKAQNAVLDRFIGMQIIIFMEITVNIYKSAYDKHLSYKLWCSLRIYQREHKSLCSDIPLPVSSK